MLLPHQLCTGRPTNIGLLGACQGSAPRKVECLICCMPPFRRAALEQREEDEPRQVRQIEDSSDDDDGRHDLNDALDDQALDLNVNYDDYRILDSD